MLHLVTVGTCPSGRAVTIPNPGTRTRTNGTANETDVDAERRAGPVGRSSTVQVPG